MAGWAQWRRRRPPRPRRRRAGSGTEAASSTGRAPPGGPGSRRRMPSSRTCSCSAHRSRSLAIRRRTSAGSAAGASGAMRQRFFSATYTYLQGDVANLDDLDRLYRTVAAEKGVVDIVFANAGFVDLLTIDAVTPEHFDKTININLRGLLFTVQKALPLMKNGDSIVLNSSVVGVKGLPGHG